MGYPQTTAEANNLFLKSSDAADCVLTSQPREQHRALRVAIIRIIPSPELLQIAIFPQKQMKQAEEIQFKK